MAWLIGPSGVRSKASGESTTSPLGVRIVLKGTAPKGAQTLTFSNLTTNPNRVVVKLYVFGGGLDLTTPNMKFQRTLSSRPGQETTSEGGVPAMA